MRGEGTLFVPQRPNGQPVPPRVRFVDVNPDYTLNDDPLLTNEQVSIRHQIKNVLTTPLGSEYHEPSYGSNVPFRVFESINRITAHLLKTDTVETLAYWLSGRIVVAIDELSVVALTDEDGYRISIPYGSIATGTIDLYVFEVLR